MAWMLEYIQAQKHCIDFNSVLFGELGLSHLCIRWYSVYISNKKAFPSHTNGCFSRHKDRFVIWTLSLCSQSPNNSIIMLSCYAEQLSSGKFCFPGPSKQGSWALSFEWKLWCIYENMVRNLWMQTSVRLKFN